MIGGALATCIVMNVVYKYMPENYDASPSNLQFSTNFFYFFGIIASQGILMIYSNQVNGGLVI